MKLTTSHAASSTENAVAIGLRVFALFLGIFFLAQSLNKLAWPGDPQLLLGRFQRWAPTARPEVRWYLEHIATPFAPLLARLIPISEFLTAMAFSLGFWIPVAAVLALFMVLNFHFGTAAFYAWDFLRDGTGPPVIGGLMGLAIGGRNLPFTMQRLFSAREQRLAIAALLVAVCVTGWSTPITAQGQAPAANIPDLSGGWLRLDSAGSGSFDGAAQNFPPAALTAAGQAMVLRGDGRNLVPAGGGTAPAHQAGDPYIVNNGACTPEGTGGSAIEPNSSAIFLLQSKDEVLMVREGPGGRRFHMDGRGHPANLPPSLYGHSIGHYEGGALIVETVGLTPGAVQGGGKRRPETRLTERFQLSPDGMQLTVTYTWDDPVLYVRPHTYQYAFERLPAGSYAFETWCDSSDPLQRQSIVPPKQ